MGSFVRQIAFLALAASLVGCAASGPSPAGYFFFNRREDHAQVLFRIRADGSGEQRLARSSRYGHVNAYSAEPPHHVLVALEGPEPRLCRSCGKHDLRRFRYDVRSDTFQRIRIPPRHCRPVENEDLSLCISTERPDSESVATDRQGRERSHLHTCARSADGSAAVLEPRSRRIFGVSAEGAVVLLATKADGCNDQRQPLHEIDAAPKLAQSNDAVRLLFIGLPPKGGERALYATTLDGKELLLVTHDKARFLGMLPGGAFVAQLGTNGNGWQHDDLGLIDPRKSAEPIMVWPNHLFLALLPGERLLIKSLKAPYPIFTVRPDGAELYEIVSNGIDMEAYTRTPDGYIVFKRFLPQSPYPALLCVRETGGPVTSIAPEGVDQAVPAGGRIVFTQSTKGAVSLMSIRPNGTDRRSILGPLDSKIEALQSLGDGWVRFLIEDDSSGGDLYVVRADGSGLRYVTDGVSHSLFLSDRPATARPSR
jgi:hypothetical protein